MANISKKTCVMCKGIIDEPLLEGYSFKNPDGTTSFAHIKCPSTEEFFKDGLSGTDYVAKHGIAKYMEECKRFTDKFLEIENKGSQKELAELKYKIKVLEQSNKEARRQFAQCAVLEKDEAVAILNIFDMRGWLDTKEDGSFIYQYSEDAERALRKMLDKVEDKEESLSRSTVLVHSR